jgi:succinoglycan biosynthesis transport protein ExoP
MTPQRFLNILQRRSIFVWSVIAVGLALMYSFRGLVPSSFAGVAHVVLVAESGARDPSVSIVDLPSIATSTVVLQRVRNALKLPVSLIKLKQDVSASVLGRSSIMAVGYHDQSAERAIDVSNAVADQLSRYYDEISTQRYDVNVNRLSTELTAEANKMRALDAQMSSVVAANPFVVSDKSIDNITLQISTIDEQRAVALAQLQGDQALAATTAGGPQASKTAQHEILAGDPAYVAARTIAARDAAQLVSDRATYTQSFPGLPGELAKVQNESDALKAEASRALSDPNAYSPSAAGTLAQHTRQLAVVAGDVARLNQLDSLMSKAQTTLGDVPTIGAKYSQLSAQRTAMETEYAALATRRANALANRAEASSLGSVVVLDRAIKADTQLAGGRTRAAVVAFVLVLALAIGTAFLVESLDPRIRRPEEIEELYGIPVVATFGSKA